MKLYYVTSTRLDSGLRRLEQGEFDSRHIVNLIIDLNSLPEDRVKRNLFNRTKCLKTTNAIWEVNLNLFIGTDLTECYQSLLEGETITNVVGFKTIAIGEDLKEVRKTCIRLENQL